MPSLIVIGGFALAGIWGLHEFNNATENTSKLVWAGVAAGAVYLGGKKLKAW